MVTAVAFPVVVRFGTMRIDVGLLLDLRDPAAARRRLRYLALWHLVSARTGSSLVPAVELGRRAAQRRTGDVRGRSLLPLDALAGFEEVSPGFLGVTFAGVAFLGLFFERRFVRLIGSVLRGMGINLREIVVVGEARRGAAPRRTLANRDALGYRVLDVIEVDPTTPDHLVLERLETVKSQADRRVFLRCRPTIARPLHGLIATREGGASPSRGREPRGLQWAWTAIDDAGRPQPIVTIATGRRRSALLLAKRPSTSWCRCAPCWR